MSKLTPSLLLTAGALYGALSAAALCWGWWRGHPNLFWRPGTALSMHVISAAAGLVLGLAVAWGTALAARWSWLDQLNRFFASVLGPVTWGQAALLALLSSLGEELFFRGAMQPAWGLWATSLLFGAMHVPPRLSLISWTVMAWILGLAFGGLFELTGALWGPIASHFTINLLNLRLVARKAEALAAQPSE